MPKKPYRPLTPDEVWGDTSKLSGDELADVFYAEDAESGPWMLDIIEQMAERLAKAGKPVNQKALEMFRQDYGRGRDGQAAVQRRRAEGPADSDA